MWGHLSGKAIVNARQDLGALLATCTEDVSEQRGGGGNVVVGEEQQRVSGLGLPLPALCVSR
jgi:hypothetical protein